MQIDYGSLATGAFAFTIALSWNEAASAWTRHVSARMAGDGDGLRFSVLRAVVTTVLVIVAVTLINLAAHHVHRVARAAKSTLVATFKLKGEGPWPPSPL